MKILIINRNLDVARYEFQSTQLNNLGLSFEKITAIEKNDLDEATIEKYQNSWQRPLRVAEIACTLSHHKCWQLVAKLDEACLVIEDDACISNKLPELLGALSVKGSYNFISLETRRRDKFLSKQNTPIIDNYVLHGLLYDKGGSAGYIIWPDAAKSLLERLKEKGASPADAFLGECTKLAKGQVYPAPLLQLDMCLEYGIGELGCCASAISNTVKPKADSISSYLKFRIRRFKVQLKLLINVHLLTKVSSNYKEAFVPIIKDEFKLKVD